MSQEESATGESGKQQPVVEPNNEVAPQEVMEPWGSDSIQQVVMAVLSVPFLVLSACYIKFAITSEERDDVWHYSEIAGVLMFCFLVFVYYSCTGARLGFNPSLIWGAAAGLGRQRTRSADSRATSTRQGDIESQSPANSESRPIDSGTPDPCSSTAAGEKEMLLQTSKPVCEVKKVSEVATIISKIALETVAEKGESIESSTASADWATADETPQPDKTDSDSELLSSGELRRRKLANLGEGKDSCSNSSDEEPVKKNECSS